MPSSKLRRELRGHGHALSPIVQIGKAGVTEGVVKQVAQALSDHELIKLRVDADSPADRFAVADDFSTRPGVNVVQVVGGMILLYKRDPHRPRYEGRRAQADEAAPETAEKASRPPAQKASRPRAQKASRPRAQKASRPRAQKTSRPRARASR